MRRSAWVLVLMGLILAASWATAQGEVNVPLTSLKLVGLGGVQAELQQVADADDGKPATRITFAKAGEERRLLAVAAVPAASPAGAKALAIRYRLALAEGEGPRAALVIFDKDGGSWYKVGGYPLAVGEFRDARISVAALRQTAFSQDESGELEWDNVDKVWLGVVIDGAAEGALEFSDARFTDEPYRPDRPLRVTGDGPGEWGSGQDPAVKSKLTTPNEGPDGKPCMKYEFTVPAGRHMYAIPNTKVVGGELEGYGALRFQYKVNIPPDMRLLVTLGEHGGAQYYVEPPGPWPAEWTTMVLPFEQFTAAGWGAKDANGKLDIESVGSVTIGTHGTAREAGPGFIMATDVEFVPQP